MPNATASSQPTDGASITGAPETDPNAVAQNKHETDSQSGGFANDPDDATNPNEEIERHKEKLRPARLRP
jgi:hypothetical protein